MKDRDRIEALRAEIGEEVALLEVTPERVAAACAQIEKIRAKYPSDERVAAFQHHMLANPEWIGVYASMAIDLIDAKLSDKH